MARSLCVGHILPLWGLQGQGSRDASLFPLSQGSSGGPHGLAKHRLAGQDQVRASHNHRHQLAECLTPSSHRPMTEVAESQKAEWLPQRYVAGVWGRKRLVSQSCVTPGSLPNPSWLRILHQPSGLIVSASWSLRRFMLDFSAKREKN